MGTKKSRQWIRQHLADPYVKSAQKEGFRSRAAYKLLEIHKKDNLIRSGSCIIDLGAAPGAWSQVAAQYVGQKGQVIAVDRLPMVALPGVQFIQGDILEPNTLQAVQQAITTPIDLVLSDMAPNLTGINSVDQPRMMELAELALGFAMQVLKPKGHFVLKLFQGEGFDPFLKSLRAHFARVKIRKPAASRSKSSEVYLIARDYKIDL
jgi:23S rRNA (uridine2552-2'-O)-methyltransferase